MGFQVESGPGLPHAQGDEARSRRQHDCERHGETGSGRPPGVQDAVVGKAHRRSIAGRSSSGAPDSGCVRRSEAPGRSISAPGAGVIPARAGRCRGFASHPRRVAERVGTSRRLGHPGLDALAWAGHPWPALRIPPAPSTSHKYKSPIQGAFVFVWRRGWDSNPRNLAVQRFSRPPQSTTLPPLHGASKRRDCSQTSRSRLTGHAVFVKIQPLLPGPPRLNRQTRSRRVHE